MDLYQTTYSRVAMGCAAVAITATIIGLAIVMPALMQVEGLYVVPSQATTAPGSIEADILPASIEVFAVRQPKIISMDPSRSPQAAAGEEG